MFSLSNTIFFVQCLIQLFFFFFLVFCISLKAWKMCRSFFQVVVYLIFCCCFFVCTFSVSTFGELLLQFPELVFTIGGLKQGRNAIFIHVCFIYKWLWNKSELLTTLLSCGILTFFPFPFSTLDSATFFHICLLNDSLISFCFLLTPTKAYLYMITFIQTS